MGYNIDSITLNMESIKEIGLTKFELFEMVETFSSCWDANAEIADILNINDISELVSSSVMPIN